MNHISKKVANEINHGRFLVQTRPDLIWGWQSPAGKKRAHRRAEMIIEHSYIDSGKRVLEIGCGTGTFTQHFLKTGGKIFALDISHDLLKVAKKRILPNDNVTFLNQKFEDCRLASSFDSIIGSSILHHLDILPALKKIRCLLKPGGTMAFAEPNFMNPQVFVTKNIPWIKRLMGDSPDETAFWPWKIKRLLQNEGIIDIKVIPFDWLHPAVPEVFISEVMRLGYCFEKLPIIKYFSGSLCITGRRPL